MSSSRSPRSPRCWAIDRDPEHRYRTAAELAEDLRLFVEDRPVRARRASEAEKFLRWCRRNPVPATLLAALVLVFWAGFGLVAWNWREAVAEREAKEQERLRATILGEEARMARDKALAEEKNARAAAIRAVAEERKARDFAERAGRSLYFSLIDRARLERQAANISEAEAILDRCDPDRRGWEWQFLKGLDHAELFILQGHDGWVDAVAHSPDGEWIATAGGGNPFYENPGQKATPGTVVIWDAVTGRPVRTLRGHTDVVTDVAFSPDGDRLVTGSHDGTARVWDLTFDGETGAAAWALAASGAPEAFAYARGGNELRIFFRFGDIYRGEAGSFDPVGIIESNLNVGWLTPAEPVAFDALGRRLVAVDQHNRREAVCLELEGRPKRTTLRGHGLGIRFATLSADGARAVTAALSGPPEYRAEVFVWDVASGGVLHRRLASGEAIDRVALDPTGRRLALSAFRIVPKADGTGTGAAPFVSVVDVDTGRELLRREVPEDRCLALGYSGRPGSFSLRPVSSPASTSGDGRTTPWTEPPPWHQAILMWPEPEWSADFHQVKKVTLYAIVVMASDGVRHRNVDTLTRASSRALTTNCEFFMLFVIGRRPDPGFEIGWHVAFLARSCVMRISELVLTAVVLALPVATYAQHGTVRGGTNAGAQQQQQMVRQQQQVQQQMVKQQQQAVKAQQRAMQQQAKAQQQQAKAQQRAMQHQQNTAKNQQKATGQQANSGNPPARPGRTSNASKGRPTKKDSKAEKSLASKSDQKSTNSAQKAAKKTTDTEKERASRERTRLAMERERERNRRRWLAFEDWLLASGYLTGYEARFRGENAYVAMEEWLAKQEGLRAQGLAVEPLYGHYRSFMAQYKP